MAEKKLIANLEIYREGSAHRQKDMCKYRKPEVKETLSLYILLRKRSNCNQVAILLLASNSS